MNIYVLSFLLFVYTFTTVITENGNGKLGDAIKNHTKLAYNSTRNQNQNEEENLLKQETHKLLSECGVENSDNNYDDDYNNRRNSNRRGNGNGNYDNNNNNRRRNSNKRYGNSNENYDNNNNYNNQGRNRNRGNRYSNYDNEDENNNSNDSNNRYGHRRYRGNSNNRYGNKRDDENYSEDDSDESSQSNYNRNPGIRRFNRTMSSNSYYYGNNGYGSGYNSDCQDENRNYYGTDRGNYDYDSRTYGYNGYSNNGNMRRGSGYTRNFDISLRAKRSNNDNNDSQCVSQCVFGYLEVLDDNRTPSETLVIKWLQDHLSNDMKRIRALREARRCFARLSTSDIEDGCEFSKSLSKCLNLDLE